MGMIAAGQARGTTGSIVRPITDTGAPEWRP